MVYLIPSFLADEARETIPPYVIEAVKRCGVIFAENLRTARRFLKAMDQDIDIDSFAWFAMHKAEDSLISAFREKCRQGSTIAILSEAGCPGIADPGQILVAEAQKMNIVVKPLVGPSSILLSLMASGMNGQQFTFHGYLPIHDAARMKKLRELEAHALKTGTTHLFIETPFRNDKLLETILQSCKPTTRLCIAMNITGSTERIQTKRIGQWRDEPPKLHKIPVIFLLGV